MENMGELMENLEDFIEELGGLIEWLKKFIEKLGKLNKTQGTS